jgi:AcrR family transcriptional regulator
MRNRRNIMLKEASERPQTYASPAILERRQRILEETRKTIARQGINGLSMNEIGQRAGVAKRTLYNAFQTRERMIATAIQEYFDEYLGHVGFSYPQGTMLHSVERLVTVVQRNRRIRNYIRAIMALYFSSDIDEDIWTAMHTIASGHNRAWVASLRSRRQLQPWIDPAKLVDDLIRLEYATINNWAQGHIPDDEIVVRLVQCYLTLMLGAVRGTTRREIEALLHDIDVRGAGALPAARRIQPVPEP